MQQSYHGSLLGNEIRLQYIYCTLTLVILKHLRQTNSLNEFSINCFPQPFVYLFIVFCYNEYNIKNIMFVNM